MYIDGCSTCTCPFALLYEILNFINKNKFAARKCFYCKVFRVNAENEIGGVRNFLDKNAWSQCSML